MQNGWRIILKDQIYKNYNFVSVSQKQYCHFQIYRVHYMHSTFQQSYVLCSEN